MPKLKRQKWREERAAAMRESQKKLITIESSLTNSPSNTLVKTNDYDNKNLTIYHLPITNQFQKEMSFNYKWDQESIQMEMNTSQKIYKSWTHM